MESSTQSRRRSYPNLHNLSLAPLSTQPLDASAPPSPSSDHHTQTPHTSYIAQKSAPTTPGILSLSRSGSRSGSRRRPHNYKNGGGYAYEGYFVGGDKELKELGDIPKAKSLGTLAPGYGAEAAGQGGVRFLERERHHRRKGTDSSLMVKSPQGLKYHTHESGDDWFHRAGLAIAGETRESKGQAWLVRRESSTSVVLDADENEEIARERNMALLSGEHFGGDELDFRRSATPRWSRVGSRAASRVNSRMGSRIQSAAHSRRESRVGSRVDLMMSGAVRSPSASVFDESEDIVEPDFVDEDGESDGDEEEVARLAQERGFGLGGWMDRLMGWTLFSVDEEADDESEDEEEAEGAEASSEALRPENMTKEERELRREVEARRRKLEREAIVAAAAVKGDGRAERAGAGEAEAEGRDEVGGWQDAAWLFSVASKVIL